jgi:hypothetical protein
MQLERPQHKGHDDVYRWKRSSTHQDPSRNAFKQLLFHLYPLLSGEFQIFNNLVRFGEEEQEYIFGPYLYVLEKTEIEKKESKCRHHSPIASFGDPDEYGCLSWSGDSESGYTVGFKQEEVWGFPEGRRTTCKCIRWKVKENSGVRKAASWEIEIPLFALYHHLQNVRKNHPGLITRFQWWLPKTQDTVMNSPKIY